MPLPVCLATAPAPYLRVATALSIALTGFGCDSPTPKCPECPETPPPAAPADPPAVADKGSAPIRIEQKCEVNDHHVAISTSIPVESIALGAGAEGTGTFRKYHHVSCIHCIDERYTYNVGTERECKENSWECSHTVVDLSAVDEGNALEFGHVFVTTADVVRETAKASAAVALLLEHLDDPERYAYLDRDKTRALAKKMQAALAKVKPGAETTLIEIPDGVIAVEGSSVELFTAQGVLSYGTASCTGIAPDAS